METRTHVVALAGAPHDAAPEGLATALGVTVLEARLALAAPMPHPVLRVATHEDAMRATHALESCGFEAMSLDVTELVRAEDMVHVERFAFTESALLATEHGPELAWSDVGVLLDVAATGSIVRTTRERERRYTARGQAVTVDVERTRTEHATERALFLFPHGGAVPWLLRAAEARYVGLGPRMRPTTFENYGETVRQIRARASSAVYDDRYVARPLVQHDEAYAHGNETKELPFGDAGIDLPVQLLARWLARPRGGPYR
jgi:hypothetical protein